jgi:hypothetical protein
MDDSFEIRRLHPQVLRVIEEYRCPSPCSGPRDEEQPKSGSFIELKRRNEARRRTDSVLWKSREILAQKQLENEELTPAPVGWTKTLTDPGQSNLLKRRGIRSKTESSSSPRLS